MATSRPFAYNPTLTPISGAIQVGTLTVGVGSGGGLTWWNGPDEDLGYVIAIPVSGNTQSTPNGSETASVAFYRSNGLNDSSFIVWAQYVSRTFNNPQTFSTASQASTWLTSNGYWNSYPVTANVTGATTNGGVYVSPFSPFGSGTSYQFNGTNGYLSYSATTDFALSTGDFTIEWFQYQTSQPSNPRIFQIGTYPTIAIGCSIEGTTSPILYLWVTSANSIKTFTSQSNLNTWIHIAIVRIGTSLKVYQNGTQIGTTLTNSVSLGNSTQSLSIGQETTATSNSYFPGYITQFRWTKGLGIYTGNFTAPTGPLSFTASANPFGGSNTSAIGAGFVKLLLQ